jgi:hypothetical protein
MARSRLTKVVLIVVTVAIVFGLLVSLIAIPTHS